MTDFFKYLTLRDEQREEKRRAEEAAREEKFQNLMLSMLQTQVESYQSRVVDLQQARRQEQEAQQKLELERTKMELQRHEEQMAIERERLDLEKKIQAERERARRAEEEKRQQWKEHELRVKEAPQMARMTENDDAELYLSEFEQRMADLQIPQERWMLNLRPLLATWVKDVVESVPRDQRSDYDVIRKSILETVNLRKGTIGHRLLTLSRCKGTTFSQWFITGKRMWRRWTEDCDNEKAGDQLLMELMYNRMPVACRNFCRDKSPTEGRELCALADKFFADRDSNPDDQKWHYRKSFGNSSIWRDQQGGEDTPKGSPSKTAQKNSVPHKGKDPDWEKKAECFICREKGHISYKCPNKSTPVSNVQLIQKLPFVQELVNGKPNKLLLDSGAAMSLVHPSLVQKEHLTGDTRLVRGATGLEKAYPLAKVNLQIGSFMDQVTAGVTEDTDWVLVGPDFNQFWGVMKEEADRRWVHSLEKGTDQISVLLTRAQKTAQQLQNQEDDELSAASGAITTNLFFSDFDDSICAQPGKEKQKLSKQQKRINAVARLKPKEKRSIADFTPNELKEAQERDESLKPLWELARDGGQNYLMKDDILYHLSEDKLGETLNQVVLPKSYRNQVIAMAHSAPTAAHLGVKKTCQKVLRDFYWPKLAADVKAACRTCEDCQKGGKGNRSKAPLVPLPVISEPLQSILWVLSGEQSEVINISLL